MAGRIGSPAYALVFATQLPRLQELARQYGYALGIHGTMTTDLDLIAVPWTEEAVEPEMLIDVLRMAVNGHIAGPPFYDPCPREKPHGRLCWSIFLNDPPQGPYLDVSVMPRAG
jgi:hypothetical protein